ncbi:MAG TPA: ATP-binding protein [Gaiellaceae bacterium]|nr:ATP-binding protein [Gaiellaceae bacterium]
MRLPGGIRVRLVLALVVVVGGALLAAYVIVVPSLEKRLVDGKLDGLQRSAVPLAQAPGFSADDPIGRQNLAEVVAAVTNARVVVLDLLSEEPATFTVGADSSGVQPGSIGADEVARSALEARAAGARLGIRRGRVTRGGRDYAEVAVARPDDVVVLFSSPLADTLATVHVIERRLGYATVAALAVAIVFGSGAAAVHARRIRRLERAAERIAEGAFDEPVRDDGDDELGELARAFERMRLRLERLESSRRAFVANASHELRTPLFALSGFLELLDDEELDEETRRGFLRTMHEQVDRLAKLATDLLDLSRVDAGGLRVEREEVDLAEVARTLASELRGLAEGQEHTLETEAAAPVWVTADEERVVQVGRALASNALLHTPPGTAVVLRVRPGAEGRAWLEVEDDGPGIPSDQLERVFERFYRVEGGRAPGSGLGLSIARELAELMGGTIRASSRPGRTVFALELPSAGVPQPAAPLVA